jgi:hypothetical protein
MRGGGTSYCIYEHGSGKTVPKLREKYDLKHMQLI